MLVELEIKGDWNRGSALFRSFKELIVAELKHTYSRQWRRLCHQRRVKGVA